MNVVIAGGGTAGHVFPAVALADRLAASGDTVSFIGSPQGQEATLVPAAGYRFHAVAAAPMKREVSARDGEGALRGRRVAFARACRWCDPPTWWWAWAATSACPR